MKGLELSQKYYIEYGAPMIKDRFPEYEERIAVGLVGPGSECYGFDDDISTDHDFGPSFCMWLIDEDYEKIGGGLSEANKEFPQTLWDINELFPLMEKEGVRIKKIAARAAKMAQSGQYNYSRAMRRSEIVAARLSLDEFIRSTISMVYLLNKKYQPYYKWAFKGTESFSILSEAREMIEQLVYLPVQKNLWIKESEQIESICGLIITELRKQGLTEHDDLFLENHTASIMSRIKNENIRALHVMLG